MKIVFIIISIVSIAFFFTYQSNKIAKPTHGFASYYTFSRLLLEGEDLSSSYDTSYFNSKIKEFNITSVQDLPNNIPTNAFLFLPEKKINVQEFREALYQKIAAIHQERYPYNHFLY